MVSPHHAYPLACLVAGLDVNGEPAALPDDLRGMADHLAALPADARSAPWTAMAAARPDVADAVARIDPKAPPPEPEADPGADERTATLADVRRLVADTSWPWPGWLAGGVCNALAADPGTGKTILGMDLARRLWLGESWPDGGANPFPEGSRTLWVPGDRHYPQLLDLAAAYGLPDEALMFNAPDADPLAGLELDDPATLAGLERRIVSEAPALVIVDTVGMTTDRNLCRPEEARAYFGPLMDIAGKTGVAFLLLTHLSKDGEALGRRIVGACRTAWKITTPDPEGQSDRRRLWVDKSYAVKPPALGMSIGPYGCSFDSNPPTEPEAEPRRPGPTAAKVKAAMEWLSERLDPNPVPVSDLRRDAAKAGIIRSESSAGTLYRARDVLGAEETVLEGRKWWRMPGVRDVQDANSDNSDSVVQVVSSSGGNLDNAKRRLVAYQTD